MRKLEKHTGLGLASPGHVIFPVDLSGFERLLVFNFDGSFSFVCLEFKETVTTPAGELHVYSPVNTFICLTVNTEVVLSAWAW